MELNKYHIFILFVLLGVLSLYTYIFYRPVNTKLKLNPPKKSSNIIVSKTESVDKLSNIEIIQAQTMLEWCEAFQNASFLFSARFHHTIAALSIGTPFAYLNSNTPKIDAILETLNEDPLEYRVNEDDHAHLKDVSLKTLKYNISNKSHRRVKMMLDLGSENFITL